MDKIKAIFSKQFFIDHGEKVGFGAAVLLTLAVLGMANRSTYDKAPEDFKKQAQKAQDGINSSVFSDKDGTFALVDFSTEKEKRLAPLNEEPFHYVVEMSPKLYPRDAQLKEPKLPVVENLLVRSGRTAIQIQPPDSGTSNPADPFGNDTTVAANEPAKAAETGPGGEFDVKKDRPMGNDGAFGAASPMGMTTPMIEAYVPPAYGTSAMTGMEGEATMMTLAPSDNRFGRGLRYNSVVGIVPHKKMMDAFKQALNTPSPELAAQSIQYLDFTIERARQQPHTEQWSDWQALDLESVNKAIAREWFYWDEEVVKVQVTSNVFTMPLPPRAMGDWKVHGSHPLMQAYMLSEDEKETERKKNEEAALKALEKKDKTKSRGFSQISLDVGSSRRQMDAMAMMAGGAAGQAGGMAAFNPSMPAGMPMPGMMPAGAGMSPEMQSAEGMPGMGGMLTLGPAITSDLLLFRYIDFEVEPGQTYKYRVKLTLRNPNYGVPAEQLEKPEIGQSETLETAWSDETPPVAVEDDVKYFVNKIPRRSGKAVPQVEMDMVQWDPALGTLELAKGQWVTNGQNIGAKVKIERSDVIREKIEKTDVTIFAPEILADSTPGPFATASDHPDLKLSQREISAQVDSGLLDEAAVVDASGQLEVATQLATAATRRLEEGRYNAQMRSFEAFRNKDETAVATNALDMYDMGGGKTAKNNKNKKAVNLANPTMMMMMQSAMPKAAPKGKQQPKR